MSPKTRFVLTWGVLGWGITTGVLFAIVMSAMDGKPFLPWLAISLVAFPVGGFFWGVIMWRWRQSPKGGDAS